MDPGTGITCNSGAVWDVMGQTYKPVQLSEASFAFDTLLLPGTFVPPHVHPDQGRLLRVLDGAFDLWLDGEDLTACAGTWSGCR